MLSFLALSACLAGAGQASAVNLLQADGPGGTYELLRTAYTVEVPDCGHAVEHITEQHDAELGRPVFVFELHVDEDDDRCTATDRQRTEIRARAGDIVAAEGETVYYAWKFRLDAGFQGSPNFTHIFQIKSDASAPVMTLTPRVGTLAIDGRIGERGATELEKFLGVWVQVELRIAYAEAGELAMTIRRIDDGATLFDYAGEADLWDADASGHDSKFGLYRSLNSRELLRDEQVRFADFCASKVSAAECADEPVLDPSAGGNAAGGAGGNGAGGASGQSGAANGGSGGMPGGSSAAGATNGAIAGGAPAQGGGGAAGSAANANTPPSPPAEPAADASAGCACRQSATTSAGESLALLLVAGCCSAVMRRRARRQGWPAG